MLSYNQKVAISDVIGYLINSSHLGWDCDLWESFSELDIEEYVGNDSISLYDRNVALKNLPSGIKRIILQKLILSWAKDENKDSYKLYETLKCLIKLEICDINSFHFINLFYNLISFFGVFEGRPLCVSSCEPDRYDIYIDGEYVRMELGSTNEPENYVAISIEGNVLEPYYDLTKGGNASMFKNLYDALMAYSSKEDFPCIHYNLKISASYYEYAGLCISVENLEYEDTNGVDDNLCSYCKNFRYNSWRCQYWCDLWNTWTDKDSMCEYINEDYYDLLERGINIQRENDY